MCFVSVVLFWGAFGAAVIMSFLGVCFSRESLISCFVLCFILCRVGQFGVVPDVRWAAFERRYLRRDAFLV